MWVISWLASAAWRNADRDRVSTNLDAEFLAGRACAAVKFEADLLVEPELEIRPLRDLGKGGPLWMP